MRVRGPFQRLARPSTVAATLGGGAAAGPSSVATAMGGEAAASSGTLIGSTWAFRTEGEARTATPRQKTIRTQGFQAMERFLSKGPSCLGLRLRRQQASKQQSRFYTVSREYNPRPP